MIARKNEVGQPVVVEVCGTDTAAVIDVVKVENIEIGSVSDGVGKVETGSGSGDIFEELFGSGIFGLARGDKRCEAEEEVVVCFIFYADFYDNYDFRCV